MKNLFKNLVIFVGLVVLLSAFTGCEKASDKGALDAGKDSDFAAKDAKDSETIDSKVDSKSKADEKGDKEKSDSGNYPPAPEAIATADIELIDGEKFNIAEQKGKVVLINLWAIWCGPCIKEMPHLNELNELYGDKGFVLVGLNTGDDIGEKESADRINKFVAKQELNYKIGYSHRALTSEFFRLGQMNGIPQSFLIDRNGHLRGIFQGGGPKPISSMKEVVKNLMEE